MIHMKPKQQVIYLVAMVLVWALWAKYGATPLMGAMEDAAKPGMAILEQPDPQSATAQIVSQNGGMGSDSNRKSNEAAKPARTVGSFDDYGDSDGYATD